MSEKVLLSVALQIRDLDGVCNVSCLQTRYGERFFSRRRDIIRFRIPAEDNSLETKVEGLLPDRSMNTTNWEEQDRRWIRMISSQVSSKYYLYHANPLLWLFNGISLQQQRCEWTHHFTKYEDTWNKYLLYDQIERTSSSLSMAESKLQAKK